MVDYLDVSEVFWADYEEARDAILERRKRAALHREYYETGYWPEEESEENKP